MEDRYVKLNMVPNLLENPKTQRRALWRAKVAHGPPGAVSHEKVSLSL